ncbi:hypothetical protein GGI43DRAFT_430521 [Trichoderma evansii]
MRTLLGQALIHQPRFNELVDILLAVQKEEYPNQALCNPCIVDEIQPFAAHNLRFYTVNTVNGFSVIVKGDKAEAEAPRAAGGQIKPYNAATDHKDIEISSKMFFDFRNSEIVATASEYYQLVISDLDKFIDFFQDEENPRGVWQKCMSQIFELFPNSSMRGNSFDYEKVDISFGFKKVQVKAKKDISGSNGGETSEKTFNGESIRWW